MTSHEPRSDKTPEPKPTRIGILGAGQLALMLAEAVPTLAAKLAEFPDVPRIEILCAGSPGDCAETVAPVLETDLTDADSVQRFAANVDLVTVESENIDAAVLQKLNLAPNAHAIGIAQDRLLEKNFFHTCGIETAPFRAVDSVEDLQTAIAALGLPAILKTRRMGYDGKGQIRLTLAAEAAAAWIEVGEVPCILEARVPFTAEVSLIAARNAAGEIVFYPLTENHHREGILRVSVAPCSASPDAACDCSALQPEAERYMRAVLTGLDYIGVLAIEFFSLESGPESGPESGTETGPEAKAGKLIANEMAPRVHNSGHWTIEGAQTSQFENHLRALLGLPLGSTRSQPTIMLNCIGTMPTVEDTALYPELHRHDYGKEARPGRKVGHLTLPASAAAAIDHWKLRLGDNEIGN